ncbi:conserved Plasmodium membrane protein, unknown function [Plasmodium gallinaceum]|uniref:Uncharacterized protein n=1 Tax=Plasmodium gallinaceum TaxID=5849 RepID=A0A1J1GSV2_PLAGA|nr:conserved Plasmodium membrane protein, unknown function [Plasmodium gallinaceum]CRG94384.1 conserved Plasmodium membrane protein, unknown function [Plasmodium gallinaceum]
MDNLEKKKKNWNNVKNYILKKKEDTESFFANEELSDDLLNLLEKSNSTERKFIVSKNTNILKSNIDKVINIDVFNYIYEMITKKNEMRKEQMKLTLFSINRCVDFFNDFAFLIKIFCQINFSKSPNTINQNIYKFIFLWFLFLFITSFFTFYLRKFFILNIIPKKHHNLFSLFKVFKEIKSIDQNNLSILYFYDRIQKTYVIINKVFEDIPQFLLCLLYMILNGKDKFIIFNILYSIIYFIINTIDLGFNYPIIGTLNLFFSTYILDDSFVEYDAAPTNKIFCLYSFFVFFIWSLLALVTKRFVSIFWFPFIYFQFSILFLISIMFLLIFLYFYFHAKQSFYLNPYYCL